MADNTTLPGTGDVVADEDIAGVKYQRVKLVDGTAASTALIGGDATNGLDVDVTRVIPGTTATALGKAEDAGHTTGDVGVMQLAVRNDVPAALATTTLDYIPLTTDASGILWVRDPPRYRSTWYDLITQASAVAALDQLCDEMELTSMTLVANGGGTINNMVLTADNLTIIAAIGWLYQVNPTAAGTNNPHDMTDANLQTARPIGPVYFTNWVATASNMMAVGTYGGVPLMQGAGLPYQCLDGTNTTSLWIIVQTLTAVTPGATTDYNLMVTHRTGI